MSSKTADTIQRQLPRELVHYDVHLDDCFLYDGTVRYNRLRIEHGFSMSSDIGKLSDFVHCEGICIQIFTLHKRENSILSSKEVATVLWWCPVGNSQEKLFTLVECPAASVGNRYTVYMFILIKAFALARGKQIFCMVTVGWTCIESPRLGHGTSTLSRL